MENKEKKDHHFVPQVYLGKFAHSTKRIGNRNHHLVSTYDKINPRENSEHAVKDICFKTKLYTVDSSERKERESIENFYANTIEADYNEFYNIITDEQKVKVTRKERELIILTIISLHLRNHYWFKVLNNFWSEMIKRHDIPNPVNVYDENGDILFPFEDQNLEKILTDQKMKTKQAFIKEHLRLTINLTKSHINDIIFIDKNPVNTGFITSDRPVICDSVAGSFRLPINKDYLLTIMPNTENVEYNTENIIRNNPFIDARLFNLLQYENAERFIIGSDLNDLKLAKSDYEKAT